MRSLCRISHQSRLIDRCAKMPTVLLVKTGLGSDKRRPPRPLLRKTQNRPYAGMILALAAAAAMLLSGCASQYSYWRIDSTYTFKKYNESRLSSDMISPDTVQFLRLNLLQDEFSCSPDAVIAKLVEAYDKDGDQQSVVPISELSYCYAWNLEDDDPMKAAAYYALCASLCYDYLAKGIFGIPNNISSKLLIAAGLYNSSVSRGILLWQHTKTPWDRKLDLDLGCRKFTISVKTDSSKLLDPAFFSEIHSSYDYEVEGLTNTYRSNGLGASIFGVHEKRDIPEDSNYPKLLYLPMTAVMEFKDGPADANAPREGFLRFYNALGSGKMDLGGHPFRNDADFTVPLTVYLSSNDPAQFSFQGLKNPASLVARSNIFMIEPYDPDKIPVLMIHGLYSSPGTFIEMYNDLIGDPEIRGRCQFWFFFYPTGLPVAESASILRKKLKALRERFDPKGDNPNFKNMLVVSHSMGGLLARTLIQDSGDTFYSTVFKVPLDSKELSEDERSLIKDTLFFTHAPYVRRVVFIAVPHRGSEMAVAWWARLLSKTISLPAHFANTASKVFLNKKRLLRELPPEMQDVIPTSVQALSPESPFIQASCKLPFDKGLKYHSIIGIRDAEEGPGSSDGIVPYSSSHLDGAESECLVHDGHTCTENPHVIAEVKRILLLHLREFDERKKQDRK